MTFKPPDRPPTPGQCLGVQAQGGPRAGRPAGRTFDPSFAPSSCGRREVTDDCRPRPRSPVCADCEDVSLAKVGAATSGAANTLLGTSLPPSASIARHAIGRRRGAAWRARL